MAVDELIFVVAPVAVPLAVEVGGNIPPGKLAKKFTGEDEFGKFETIVVDAGRLKYNI